MVIAGMSSAPEAWKTLNAYSLDGVPMSGVHAFIKAEAGDSVDIRAYEHKQPVVSFSVFFPERLLSFAGGCTAKGLARTRRRAPRTAR